MGGQKYTRRQVLKATAGAGLAGMFMAGCGSRGLLPPILGLTQPACPPDAADPVAALTDLARHIQATPMADTHEHMPDENFFRTSPPDALKEIFDHYTYNDMRSAGASEEAVQALQKRDDARVKERFEGLSAAWAHCHYTGYGEASRLIASRAFGIQGEITTEAVMAAHAKFDKRDWRNERLRILRDVANLDHIQVHTGQWACPADPYAPEFFFCDLAWDGMASGGVDPAAIEKATGVTVKDIGTLRQGIEKIFEKNAPTAIAVKSGHAYSRTLAWSERTDGEADAILQKKLRGAEVGEQENLALGDWILARGVEMAAEHDLPFKIHTGYLNFNNSMQIDRVRPGQLCPLLAKYPKARFVLFHMGYPYQQELVAMAKHYRNVYLDMCWAWALDPYGASDFLRRYIHAVPSSKLFVFGGDTWYPDCTVGYAAQTRAWLTRTLQAEVLEGCMTEAEAMSLADRLMLLNARACYNVAQKAAHNRAVVTGEGGRRSRG